MRRTEERGITLIALIITIIVMLVLIGVTVNVALNGGLFDTTKEASRKTEKSNIYEQIIASMVIEDNGDVDVESTYEAAKIALESQGRTVREVHKQYGTKSYRVATLEDVRVESRIISKTFLVVGNYGEYEYKITTEKIIALNGEREEEKKQIDEKVATQIVVSETGETVNVYSTVYYELAAGEMDVAKTFENARKALEEDGKEVVIIYKEYDKVKLTKIVIDVIGKYGTYAYSIASENPADNPIVELEEMDIEACAIAWKSSSAGLGIRRQYNEEDIIFETELDAFKYIGQVCLNFNVTDIKGVLECIELIELGKETTYEELEASALRNGMITEETENPENTIFEIYANVLLGGPLTVREYAMILYERFGDVDIFETEEEACSYISGLAGVTVTDTKGLLEAMTNQEYKDIEADALDNGIITEQTENPESVILENIVETGMHAIGVKTLEDFAIVMNIMSKYEAEDENDEKPAKSLVINKEIVEPSWLKNHNIAIHWLDTNQTYDVRLYANNMIGRKTIRLTNE